MLDFKRMIPIAVAVSVCGAAFASEEIVKNSSMVNYPSGNAEVGAYLALPNGNGPFPAVILIHEWWGLNDWVKQNADDFSTRGYAALAVDLYRGAVAADRDEAHELSRGLPSDRAVRDLKSAMEYLKSREDIQGDSIGVVGWCMGGGYSLQAAMEVDGLDACVIAYGRVATEASKLESVEAPILGIFGEADRGIPVDTVREFETAAKEAGVDIQLEIYPGAGHAFMNQNNERGYNAEAARDAWTKIFQFFQKHLRDN